MKKPKTPVVVRKALPGEVPEKEGHVAYFFDNNLEYIPKNASDSPMGALWWIIITLMLIAQLVKCCL